ncbi:MAG: hypothetical protein ACON38_05470 [Akkermansiaceae bacterium]
MHNLFLITLTSASLLLPCTAAIITLGDQTLNPSSNDGWSSNSHVLTNTDGPGPGGEVYQYTNNSGGAEIITPGNWSYYVQGGADPDLTTFSVTPFLVRVDQGLEDPTFSVVAIGTTRVGGAGMDFETTGEHTSEFGGEPFTIQDGETIAIGVIDANADGTGPAHVPAGGIIPFDGGAGGDNNHWYNGDPGPNTYPNGTPGAAGIGGILTGTESADINRNYQFNITIETTPTEDQDGDGMGDAYEDANGLDKTVDDSLLDLDGDTVNNITEFNNGTKPNDKDSDGDTLEDGWETKTGIWLSATDTGTDPLLPDSDGDTLGDEIENCSLNFVDAANPGTDPNSSDTDGDGISDINEITGGTDPTDSNDPPPPSGDAITLGDLTLNASSNDGWSSNSHVQLNTDGAGPGGEFYQYTNDSGSAQEITPVQWSYYIQGPDGADINTFVVTPFLVKVIEGDELLGPSVFEVASIGAPRVGGVDYTSPGEVTSQWGNDEPFILEDGETVAIGVIDANPDGTGSSTGGIIPFDGEAGGDNNHWYNGNSAPETYPNGTPGGVGVGGQLSGTESADTNRNYQFNITLEVGTSSGLPFQIEEISLDPETDRVTLTWNSKDNRTYSLFYSIDLTDFDSQIDNNIPSGGEVTTVTFPNPIPGGTKVFFRISENPR